MYPPILTRLLMFLGDSLRLIKWFIGIVAGVITFSTLAFLSIYFYFALDLPDIKTLDDYSPPVITEVFADDDTKIGEFWLECRIFTPFEKIPKQLIQAFIDSEDARFFEHKGVDMRSIGRAFVANLKAGSITQGGSTISQQITRSLLLTRERTWKRKIREAILATRLERYLDKEQILTLYLNQIYLGNRAYGVAAAARNYFHRSLDELTLAQMALIAGLPTAPTTFSPVNSREEARKRQLHVLRRMVDEGHITQGQADAAAQEDFTIYVAGTDKYFDDPDAGYFIEHIRRLVKDHYGDTFLYHKGLKIYTTVNMSMQRAATRAIRQGLESLDRRLGWRGPLDHIPEAEIASRSERYAHQMERMQERTIVWPPHRQALPEQPAPIIPGKMYRAIVTGFAGTDTQILIGTMRDIIPVEGVAWARPASGAWLSAQGSVFIRDPKKALKVGNVVLVRLQDDGRFALAQEPQIQSALMAMNPHDGFITAMVGGYDFSKSEFNRATQSLRQPGSSFKPFVYAAALDKGYTYNTTIMDAPVVYQVGRREVWSPKNYGGGYKGPTPFQNAIRFSRNVPTVKITYDIGTHYLTAFERKMGISTQIDKYLSMALGANGVHLAEMVRAYAIFDNGGKIVPAIAIKKIVDSRGEVIEALQDGISPPPPAAEIPSAEKVLGASQDDDLASFLNEREILENELNMPLFRKGFETIKRDKLNLTPLEIKTLYGKEIPAGYAITPQTAFLMVNLLKSVVEGGTATRVRALEKPAAGKTGTTNDETDTWFIGFVPDLVAGVWVGYDEVKKIARGAAGGTVAAPIFLDFMKQATESWEAKDFTPPEEFPMERIASLPGGSAVFGAEVHLEQPTEYGGPDRAGEFFEEDFESFSDDY